MSPSTPHTKTPDDSLAAAIQAGKDLTQQFTLSDGRQVLASPTISNGHIVFLAEKLPTPRFLTASPIFHETSEFVAYVSLFKQPGTRIFSTKEGVFHAVVDYHQAPSAQKHGDHTAALVLLRSPEWNIWKNHSEQKMDQNAFAEFLEDNAADILNPGAEAMLEVANGLHATTGATFRRAINQSNGQVQFQYDENIDARVAGGTKEVPTTFQVGVRPFYGTERYSIDCRLRYRINGGALSFHYKALHLDALTEAAIDAATLRIADGTGIRPALGNAVLEAVKRGI